MRLLLTLLLFLGTQPAPAQEPRDAIETPPPTDEFLLIPLYLHVLSAPGEPDVDCKLADEDLRRILGKVNGIWNKVGIHWGLAAIVRVPAARLDRFRAARDFVGRDNLGLYRTLIPDESRKTEGLHVFYVHDLPVNGVWMGTNFAIVKETAKLREVEGGIDEPIPRVTAHELGHALGLDHRQARTNLLASGTTGTSLNRAERETARKKAGTIAGVLTMAEARERAGKAEPELAGRIAKWITEVEASSTSKQASP